MAITPITVEEEFKKNVDLKKEDLDHIRDWMQKQSYLPDAPDLDLIFFLHSCFFSIERTKQTMDSYYTIRTHVPEFFSDRDPCHPTIVNAMDVLTFFPLPDLTKDGDRIFYLRFHDTDPARFNLANGCKYFVHVKDLMLWEYGTSNGFVIVIDLDGVVFGHVAKLGVMTLKKILTYLQEAMPVRLRGVHFINPVPFMDMILALMKPFMKPELIAMLYVHTQGMESFYKHVEKRILHNNLGGNAGDLHELRDATISKVKANKDFFIREEKLRVVESMRPGKAKNAGDVFGVEGSFKKLDID